MYNIKGEVVCVDWVNLALTEYCVHRRDLCTDPPLDLIDRLFCIQFCVETRDADGMQVESLSVDKIQFGRSHEEERGPSNMIRRLTSLLVILLA